jgi:hypothetical protein
MMVMDLQPGQRIHVGGMSAIFVARTRHPIWPTMQLVVWKMDDGTWSHDALSMTQDVGQPDPWTVESLLGNLKEALLGNRGASV